MAEKTSETILRDYQILCEVEKDHLVSQRDLAAISGLNLATINQILKRLIRKGCVKTKQINAKRVAYYLTPQGFAEKMRLVMSYAGITIRFFAAVRKIATEKLREMRENGVRCACIIGVGELAEAAYLSLQEVGIALTAVYGPRVGENWLGNAIKPFSEFCQDGIDAVVIAEFDLPADFATRLRHSSLPCVDLPHLLSGQMAAFARKMEAEEVTEY